MSTKVATAVLVGVVCLATLACVAVTAANGGLDTLAGTEIGQKTLALLASAYQ